LKLSKEVKVGAVVVAAIAFLIYGVNYLKGIDLFKHGRQYYVIYDDLAGLASASPVQYQGLKVGQVVETELIKDSKTGRLRMLVTFIIDNDMLDFPKNSRAKLISADLFGTRAIQILPGEGKEFAMDGDTLISEEDMSLASKVDAQIAPIKQKAENLMGSIDTMVSVVSRVLGDNSDDLEASIESFKLSLRNLKSITDKLNVMMDNESGKVSAILSKLESITGNIQKNNHSIDQTLDNVAVITDSLAKSDLAGTVRNLNKTVTDLNGILSQVNQGEGTLGKLVSSDSLYMALVSTNDQLNRLLENIKEHPNRYLHFSVIGRKEKGIKLDAQEEKKLKEILNK